MKNEKDYMFTLLDGCILGIIATMYLLMLLTSYGCSTTQCPPCVPEVETVTINVPVDSCSPPESLPTLTYPEWPRVPTAATEDVWKAFYADVVATQRAREKIFLDRIEAVEKILDGYR